MQLILAESYYHSEEPEKALAALNELRRKRIADVSDYTMQTLPPVDHDDLIQVDAKGNALTPLLYAIHCERRKELFLEGDRWYELKRNGCPEFWVAKQGLKYTTYSWMYTLSGSKAPDFDTYELFRATHSHNSPQYSHIVGLSSHFYAHIGAGPKVFHPPISKLM